MRLFRLLGVVGVLLTPVFAQSVYSGDVTPPPPAYNVTDNAGLYARDPEGLRAVSERLRSLETRFGFRCYVLIEPVVMGANPVELAARLHKAWLPDGDGFVIVYESDTKQLGFSRGYEVRAGDATKPAEVLPTFYATGLLDRIRSQLDPKMDSASLLDRTTELLVADLSGFLEKSQRPQNSKETLRMALVLVGGLCLIGLLGLAVSHWSRKREKVKRRTYRFPQMPDQQRLGAPYGAKVSSHRFGETPPS